MSESNISSEGGGTHVEDSEGLDEFKQALDDVLNGLDGSPDAADQTTDTEAFADVDDDIPWADALDITHINEDPEPEPDRSLIVSATAIPSCKEVMHFAVDIRDSVDVKAITEDIRTFVGFALKRHKR